MQFDLEKAVEQIKNNEYFIRLKNVREDTISHDGETTYEHCLKTYEKSKELVSGNLITNNLAKESFNRFVNDEIGGIKRGDLLQLIALAHDCGKMVIFEDAVPLFVIRPYSTDPAPNHGYWGSLILENVLAETEINKQALEYMKNCVRLHLAGKECWTMKISQKELLWELKLRAENYHSEMIINIYCDIFYNKNVQDKIQLALELLNMPDTFNPIVQKEP